MTKEILEDPSKLLIRAKHNMPGELLIYGIARIALKRRFEKILYRSVEPIPTFANRTKKPIIFYANHNTSWDGYVGHIIVRKLFNVEGYIMMDHFTLKSFPFIRWAGGFSVYKYNGRAILASIKYISNVLREAPGRALWIYPQGHLVPQEKRPLGFEGGLARIISLTGECYVYPVTVRYEYFEELRPYIFISLGPVRHFSGEENYHAKKLVQELENTLTDELDKLRDDVNNQRFESFTTVVKGSDSLLMLAIKVIVKGPRKLLRLLLSR